MPCQPVMLNFYPTTIDIFDGTTPVDSPYRIRVRNDGDSGGEIIVDVNARPAGTGDWFRANTLAFPTVSPNQTDQADIYLGLTPNDYELIAVARGNPPGAPLPGSVMTIYVVAIASTLSKPVAPIAAERSTRSSPLNLALGLPLMGLETLRRRKIVLGKQTRWPQGPDR